MKNSRQSNFNKGKITINFTDMKEAWGMQNQKGS